WYVQYWRWISGIITEGNFGRSITRHMPVEYVIGERLGNTVRLSIATLILLYAIAIPLGILAGRRNGKPVDKAILFYTFFAIAMPTIIFAIMNVFIFGFTLGWVPIRGSLDVTAQGFFEIFKSRLHHLILPALTGALIGTAGIINFLRGEIIDTQNSDFVTTARSKGVPARRIYNVHILRNSMLPIAPSIAASVAFLFVGAVFIERVFSYPGMGELFLTALVQRDFPVTNTIVLMLAFFTAIATLLGDIVLTIVDPRIRIR
ncbi:MAG: ABC transporter permease, partial [Defluviitaleaceae bacterium]|nr:ABC transporter permease [Defluviitaleaceae bacterium]